MARRTPKIDPRAEGAGSTATPVHVPSQLPLFHGGGIAAPGGGVAQRQLAPPPQLDRYPIIIGSNLTIQYLSSVYRIAQNGYRQQYVDVLDELLDKDPHAFCVLVQRVLSVAGGKIELVPAVTEGRDAEEAANLRDLVQTQIDGLPQRTQSLAALLFNGLFYGAGGIENIWLRSSQGWGLQRWGFIHSRRIAYPDQANFDVHIWDQGAVNPMGFGYGTYEQPTTGVYGLRVVDYPGKFLMLMPQLRGDYPGLREGLGRQLGWWMAFKVMAARAGATYVERYAKPFALAYYATGAKDGEHRAANDDDILAANRALGALGIGSLASAALPDSVKVALEGPAFTGGGNKNGFTVGTFIDLCDAQISKAVRGGTLQTDAGVAGARSLGEVHEKGDVRNARYDAACLTDLLQRELVWWMVHLNAPGREHLAPRISFSVEQIDPDAHLERALKLAASNAPVDADDTAKRAGVKLLPEGSTGRRLAPLKPSELAALSMPTDGAGAGTTPGQSLLALAQRLGVSVPASERKALEAAPAKALAAALRAVFATTTTPTDGAEPDGSEDPEEE